MKNKTKKTTAQSLLSGGSATCVKNFQCVLYDDFAGFPLKVTFLNDRWWVTSPSAKLQPLEDYFEGADDINFNYLCEAGGKVGALALTKMLGLALTNPETDVVEVLHSRVSELRHLGVELDLMDELLVLELVVISNEGNPARQGKYSAICNLADNICEQIFDIDAFDSKEDAEKWTGYLFDYLEKLNINFTFI